MTGATLCRRATAWRSRRWRASASPLAPPTGARAAPRLQRIGDAVHSPSHRKAAQRFLRELSIPPSWTYEEWDLLAQTIRYHRGPEPTADRGAFSRLHEDEQRSIRALAGVLRLARALRKCG